EEGVDTRGVNLLLDGRASRQRIGHPASLVNRAGVSIQARAVCLDDEGVKAMMRADTLLTGLVVGESPRWHDGRLWFCNWGAQEVVAVDLQGQSEVVAHSDTIAGYSIDWLADGRMLLTGQNLLRREPDGSFVPHADLSGQPGPGWNEIVVDAR